MNHETLADAARLLEEIGVGPLWLRRSAASGAPLQEMVAEDGVVAEVAVPTAVAVLGTPVAAHPSPAPVSVPVVATPRPAPVASDDGLPPWLTEMDDVDMLPAGFIPDDDDDDGPAPIRINPAIATMNWAALKETVASCQQCNLCQGRKKTAFGVGDEKAKWLFIGEGPGRNEDLQGEPFVGAAGKLLDNMLAAMGLKRGENAYIANIVKCRPTDENGRDRPPSAEEVAACLPYLQRQIALIQPTVLVALGKTAALSLLGLDPTTPVSKLRGTVHRYQQLPLVVTYHPAYLLRQLGDKSKAWSDLCLAMTTYAHTATDNPTS
jgi:uracil-DNA glycosylase